MKFSTAIEKAIRQGFVKYEIDDDSRRDSFDFTICKIGSGVRKNVDNHKWITIVGYGNSMDGFNIEVKHWWGSNPYYVLRLEYDKMKIVLDIFKLYIEKIGKHHLG